jgi:hypothetical protein
VVLSNKELVQRRYKMEFTLKLFITDEFGSHDVRTYSTMAENIDKAYEKIMNMFYAEKTDSEYLYKVQEV